MNGHLNVGGIEKSLTDLLAHLNYSIYDVDLLLLYDRGAYSVLLPQQVHVIFRENTFVYGPFWSSMVRSLFHFKIENIIFRLVISLYPFIGSWVLAVLRPILGIRNNYDCAIAYRTGLPCLLVSFVVKASKKLCWWHHGECNCTSNELQLIRKQWKKMDNIISVSYGCKKVLIEKMSMSEDRIKVIPNIIDIEGLEFLAGKKNPYSDMNCLNILSLGRLCQEKHIEDIPEIAKILLDKGIRYFRWYIIGDGTKYEEIIHKIEDYRLEDKVIMLGQKSNPYPYLYFADMLVHTSYVEAQCLTILEAMALHTPCVVTETVIPQDFTKDGVNCVIADQNIKSQANYVAQTLMNMDGTQKLINNGFNMVKSDYSSSTILPLIDAIIR